MSVEAKVNPVVRALARVGCCSVATVYVLIGVWAMLALLQVAKPAADEERILQRMLELPFGRVFIAAVALGNVGYILWLLFEAVFDPYRFGKTWKGLVERAGTALSAVSYVAIVWSALKVLLGTGGEGEEQRRQLTSRVLEWPGGQWLIGLAGLVVAIAAVYQIKYVYDGEHRRRVDVGRNASGLGRRSIDVLGWAGYGARCVILLVLGGFLLRAAVTSNARAVGDTDSAFDFLGLGGGRLGDTVFSVVALGTVGYGVLMYITGLRFCFHAETQARGP